MTASLVEIAGSEQPADATSRLLVTVRDPRDRHYIPVGLLRCAADGFSFGYFQRVVNEKDFTPLPGLTGAVSAVMHSPALFPLFAERVMSARRSDVSVSMDALGLTADATPFEILSRSHGQRVGDTVEVLPLPRTFPDNSFELRFLAHGVRYLPTLNQDRISQLHSGERLVLRADPTNPANPRAQLVTDTDALALGWVPDPLLEVLEACQDHELSVERASGPEAGFHFRLLVRMQARLEDGARPYEGPEWMLVGEEGASAEGPAAQRQAG